MLFRSPAVYRASTSYLFHMLPLGVFAMAIRQVALTGNKLEQEPHTLLWRATALVFATWPVYSLAWLLALLRIPVSFQPTPKTKTGRLNPWWLVPQVLSMVLLSAGSLHAMIVDKLLALPLVIFAVFMILLQIPFLIQNERGTVSKNLTRHFRIFRRREPDHADKGA